LNPIDTGGPISDIGGGGEGIIGNLNGKQVIAIDEHLRVFQEVYRVLKDHGKFLL